MTMAPGLLGLEGRRVLVTGGSRGIGAACCDLFARAGASVAVHYNTRRDAADAVVGALPADAAGGHFAIGGDLADEAAVRRIFGEVEKRWGALDCLVNNAGIWVRNPVATLDVGSFEETMRVNVTGSFVCAREAVRLLEASSDGNIVNLTSTAGQRGEAFYSPYAASKGAMISATKAWATELAPKVRVNSVAPGWVDTDMSAAALRGDDAERRAIELAIPLHRIATAEDIAGPVLFLASKLARHLTGEIVNVNGGSVLAG
jgi:3-oxoacyl-[acyl-carrier protein] reductase